MKGKRPRQKRFSAAAFIAISFLVGCCMHSPASVTQERGFSAADLKPLTVALVYKDEVGDTIPFCAGVWVDDDKILTADHCARMPVEKFVSVIAALVEDPEVLEQQLQYIEDGFQIEYITDADYTGVLREPKVIRKSRVLFHDRAHDVAVLEAKDPPLHPVATLATNLPELGEDVHVMGHTVGLAWSYSKGVVSAFREANFRPIEAGDERGPFIQIAAAVFRGNSGGGAFNQKGELIGIASFMPPAPSQCFFIHLETIRAVVGVLRRR